MLQRIGAVGLIDLALAANELAMAAWALLDLAAGYVKFVAKHAAIVTRAQLRLPVVLLPAIGNTREGDAVDRDPRDLLGGLDLRGPALRHPHAAMLDVPSLRHTIGPRETVTRAGLTRVA